MEAPRGVYRRALGRSRSGPSEGAAPARTRAATQIKAGKDGKVASSAHRVAGLVVADEALGQLAHGEGLVVVVVAHPQRGLLVAVLDRAKRRLHTEEPGHERRQTCVLCTRSVGCLNQFSIGPNTECAHVKGKGR